MRHCLPTLMVVYTLYPNLWWCVSCCAAAPIRANTYGALQQRDVRTWTAGALMQKFTAEVSGVKRMN